MMTLFVRVAAVIVIWFCFCPMLAVADAALPLEDLWESLESLPFAPWGDHTDDTAALRTHAVDRIDFDEQARNQRDRNHGNREVLVDLPLVDLPLVEQPIDQPPIDRSPAQTFAYRVTARRRLPADFEQQSALIVGGGALATAAPSVFTDLVKLTSGCVPLLVLVNDDSDIGLARECLKMHRVAPTHTYLVAPHDTMWARDYGPLVISQRTQQATSIVDSPYAELERNQDDAFPGVLARSARLTLEPLSFELPGGNVMSNGSGICLTTTRVQDDNPGFTQAQIADGMALRLGANQVVVLQPIKGESTGHVDMFATFTDEKTVVVGSYRPEDDQVNARILDQNAAQLARVPVGDGIAGNRDARLRVVRIPMPHRHDGTWPTYTNVVFANHRLLVPSYEFSTAEQLADIAKIYAALLPGREIHFVRADDLISSGGALHCVVANLGPLSPRSLVGLELLDGRLTETPRQRRARFVWQQ